MRAYMEKTKINKDKGGPRRTLVERASDNTQGGADAFKQSERIIKSTQAMTDGLKLKRKTAADEMEADSKEMARLDRELDEFRRKYDAVCQSYDDNVAKRNHLRATLADAKRQMDDMQTTCGEWAARNRRDQYKFNSKLVSEELRELRGYSVEPGSTCTRKEAQSRTRTSRTPPRPSHRPPRERVESPRPRSPSVSPPPRPTTRPVAPSCTPDSRPSRSRNRYPRSSRPRARHRHQPARGEH